MSRTARNEAADTTWMSEADRAYWERQARSDAALQVYDPEATLVSPPSSEGTSTRLKRSK